MALALALAAACSGAAVMPDAGHDGSIPDASLIDGPSGIDVAGSLDAADGTVDADGASPMCGLGACDPREVAACEDAGTCVLLPTGAACSTAGAAALGTSCGGPGDCEPGLACVLKVGEVGLCERICCDGDGSACPDGSRCGGTGTLVDETTTGWSTCVEPRTCDVLNAAEVCDPGEGCYIVAPDSTTDCRRAGVTQDGEACTDASDCVPGFACVGLSVRHCARLCSIDPGGSAPCPEAAATCVRYSQTPEGVGLCTVASE